MNDISSKFKDVVFLFIVCFEVKVVSVNMTDRWSIGLCSSDSFHAKLTKLNHDVNTNIVRCCLLPGKYVLICESENPYSWRQGFVEIQGRKYCNDFMGFKAHRLVDITGKNGNKLNYSCALI